jgi:BirA family biotin operon repressor/biotin-[acetyl-CoA-carboxylase] ligase
MTSSHEGTTLLDAKKIKLHHAIPIEIFESLASTNDYLKESGNTPCVCLAEMQTAGRGQLERTWHSPFGENIYLSIRLPLTKKANELSGLSLVVGLAICKTIEAGDSLKETPQVKWPNDVLIDDKKIAGTLIEMNKDSLIIGIGLNTNMKTADIHQAWTSLRKLTGHYHDRNVLCAELINHVTQYSERFMKLGLGNFETEWKERDYLFNKEIQLMHGDKKFSGTGAGINQDGHLVLKFLDGTTKAFSSGESSLLKS